MTDGYIEDRFNTKAVHFCVENSMSPPKLRSVNRKPSRAPIRKEFDGQDSTRVNSEEGGKASQNNFSSELSSSSFSLNMFLKCPIHEDKTSRRKSGLDMT